MVLLSHIDVVTDDRRAALRDHRSNHRRSIHSPRGRAVGSLRSPDHRWTTSAGRVGSRLPVPGVVVVERAIRDEGTSYHYLSASESVEASAGIADALEAEVLAIGLPVQRGLVWTTDAPYRETAEQIDRYARMGALAVEMQAASLFAFAFARGVAVGMVAHVTNAPGYDGERFDKGSHELQRDLLHAVCRGARRFLNQLVISG